MNGASVWIIMYPTRSIGAPLPLLDIVNYTQRWCGNVETDRQTHLHGEVRKALEANAELFDGAPVIVPVDLVGTKVGA